MHCSVLGFNYWCTEKSDEQKGPSQWFSLDWATNAIFVRPTSMRKLMGWNKRKRIVNFDWAAQLKIPDNP